MKTPTAKRTGGHLPDGSGYTAYLGQPLSLHRGDVQISANDGLWLFISAETAALLNLPARINSVTCQPHQYAALGNVPVDAFVASWVSYHPVLLQALQAPAFDDLSVEDLLLIVTRLKDKEEVRDP